MRRLGAGLGNVHYVIYIHWYWIYTKKNWGIYVSWINILVLDVYCQQLGNVCYLEKYISIVYVLPTIGEYMSVGGCHLKMASVI